MTTTNTTTVRITTETRDRLIALGGMNNSYEDVITMLLDEWKVCRGLELDVMKGRLVDAEGKT